MSRTVRVIGQATVLALVVVVVAALACKTRSRAPTDTDYVVVAGDPLPGTAGEEQRRLIRDLARSEGQAVDLATLSVDYPADRSIFPPEIVAPTFLWHDAAAAADNWLVQIHFDGDPARFEVLTRGGPPPRGEIDPRCITTTNELYRPTEYQASAVAWKPAPELWAAIKRHSMERPATVTFLGYDDDLPDRVISRGTVTFTTSRDPVGATLFYRDVPLMPFAGKDGVIKPLDANAQPLIAWRLKDISRPDSRVLLSDMPTCANCHSFSADGATLAMDLDGPEGDKGAYAIAAVDRRTVIDDAQVITWNAFAGKPPGLNTLGFLSRISPDGRYVVTTVNEAIYVRNFPNFEFLQVFYPTRGILAYYSQETGQIAALPGADDPAYVHCNAVWSPDGSFLIFARARARDPYDRHRPVATYAGDPNETPIQYDLYRIPFNEGRGGVPQPVPGASNNGMSNAFPKISPDGRWLAWVQSRNGLLMRPDGKLWIAPLAGGEPRLMRANMSPMNSWHSFSPNSRWMVFSSKANRPYTQMFLTHIDERGQDSPAVLIENATAANRAVNLPEFVNVSYDEFTGIDVPAVDHYEPYKRGTRLAKEERYVEALTEFEKALEGSHREWRLNDWRIHESASKVLLNLGDTERALQHIEESLALNPYNDELQANMGLILFERGQLPRAREHLDIALRLAPGDARHWYNRAVLRATVGDGAGAIDDYGEAIRRDPDYGKAYNGRGTVLRSEGRLWEAAIDFDAGVRLLPDDPTGWYFRALIREATGDAAGAARDASRALELCPADGPHAREIEALLVRVRDAVDGEGRSRR